MWVDTWSLQLGKQAFSKSWWGVERVLSIEHGLPIFHSPRKPRGVLHSLPNRDVPDRYTHTHKTEWMKDFF